MAVLAVQLYQLCNIDDAMHAIIRKAQLSEELEDQ